MTPQEQYKFASDNLQRLDDMTRKVTAKARQRIAAHSLKAQLEAHLDDLAREFSHDQSDINLAFEADKLPNTRGFE